MMWCAYRYLYHRYVSRLAPSNKYNDLEVCWAVVYEKNHLFESCYFVNFVFIIDKSYVKADRTFGKYSRKNHKKSYNNLNLFHIIQLSSPVAH